MAEFLRLKLMPLEKKLKATQSEWPLYFLSKAHTVSERCSTIALSPLWQTHFSSSFSHRLTRPSEAQETNPGGASQQTIHHQVRSGHHQGLLWRHPVCCHVTTADLSLTRCHAQLHAAFLTSLPVTQKPSVSSVSVLETVQGSAHRLLFFVCSGADAWSPLEWETQQSVKTRRKGNSKGKCKY